MSGSGEKTAGGNGLSTQGDENSSMTSEDRHTVLTLYQQNPKLWTHFRNIIDFLDVLETRSSDYKHQRVLLKNIETNAKQPLSNKDMQQLVRFAVAVGFAEKSAELYTRISRELDDSHRYMAGVPSVLPNVQVACWLSLKSVFLNYSFASVEDDFCVRIARKGVLECLLDELKHMQHLSADVLDEGHLYFEDMGVINNCCRHTSVVAIARELGAVEHLLPFTSKSTTSVRGLAYMTLSRVVEDSELDVVKLDPEVLQFYTGLCQAALASQASGAQGWSLEEMLAAVVVFARCDLNRHLLMEDGSLQVLEVVLREREDRERRHAVCILAELVQTHDLLQLIANRSQLCGTLPDLVTSQDPIISQRARSILDALKRAKPSPQDCPHLTDLMAGRQNVLTILHTSKVQYVLDLFARHAGGGRKGKPLGDVTCLKVLQALTELAESDDATRQEIADSGGLGSVLRCLKEEGDEAVQRQALLILRALSDGKICRHSLQDLPGMDETLRTLCSSKDMEVSELACCVLHNICGDAH